MSERKPTERQRFIADMPGRARHYGEVASEWSSDDSCDLGACGAVGAVTTNPEYVTCRRCFRTRAWKES